VFANTAYTFSEDAEPGYTQTGIACVDNADQSAVAHPVSLNEGQSVTCTISNDDAAPGLTLVKNVTNDHGGTVLAGDFILRLTGGIYTGAEVFTTGATPTVVANTAYTLGEDAVAGYLSTGIACVDNADQSAVAHPVNLNVGQSVTCTISNDDVQPLLTMIKVVINEDGGLATPTDWILTATGDPTISGVSGDPSITGAGVKAGNFTLTESGPGGYVLTSLECVGNATPLSGTILTIAVGEDVVCVFTNDDQSGVILVDVVTTPGGLPDLFDFTLSGGNTATVQRENSRSSTKATPVYQEFSLADGDLLYNSGSLLPSSENGDYAVELVAFNIGWTLISETCDDGSDPAAINLAADGIVTCTFVFEKDAVEYTPLAVPVNDKLALLLLTLMLLATGWYFRPAGTRKF